MSTDALFDELKKIKRQEFYASIFTGLLVGIIIYGLAKHGFGFTYTLIPLILIAANVKNSTVLKENRQEIQKEINRRAP